MPVPTFEAFEIVAHSRLHFGLLDTVEPFGGAGLMITEPRTRVRFEPAPEFSTEGPATSRVRDVAARFAEVVGLSEGSPRCAVRVLQRPEAHTGLGTGTQLAMAVAEGLCRCTARELEAETLAQRIAGRGRRSAVGIHGYWHGGFIHEAAANGGAGLKGERLNPVIHRIELPTSWRIILWQPASDERRIAGEEESARFAALPRPPEDQRRALRELLEGELVPAAAAADFRGFSQAVYQYNRLSGLYFAAIQGGPYNGSTIEQFVNRLRSLGVLGVGQSSWGPVVFALAESEASAAEVAAMGEPPWERMAIARPANRGRCIDAAF